MSIRSRTNTETQTMHKSSEIHLVEQHSNKINKGRLCNLQFSSVVVLISVLREIIPAITRQRCIKIMTLHLLLTAGVEWSRASPCPGQTHLHDLLRAGCRKKRSAVKQKPARSGHVVTPSLRGSKIRHLTCSNVSSANLLSCSFSKQLSRRQLS